MSWELTGNPIPDATSFLGTTTIEPLIIKTHGAERLRIDSTGNVGIGATAPDALLDVRGQASFQGPLSINHASMTGVGSPGDTRAAITFGATDTPSAYFFGAYSGDTAKANTILGLYSYQFGNWLQFWGPNGNISIGTAPFGTTTAYPKLTVAGPDATVTVETAEVLRIMRPGVLGIKNSNSAGFFVGAFQPGINGASRLDMNVAGGPYTANGAGSIPDNTIMSLLGNGSVGIGTTSPGTGTTGQGGTPFGNIVLDLVSTGRPVLGIKSASASGQLATLVMSASNTSSKDIHWNLDSSGSLTLHQYSAAADTMTFYNNGNVGIGTATPSAKLTVNGDISVSGDVVLTGADCAEEFDIAEAKDFEPGTVMVIDQAGCLQQSQRAYDTRVAGVISGAGSYKPGLILDRRQSQDNRVPVALVGKVYCKVDAQYAPIEVGDLLTTSETLGHAMKAEGPHKAFGAVLGKALHGLSSGQGLVPILIALQ